MSYNVLAQQYLETMPYLYSKCYREDLEWPIRQQRLLDHFKESEADVSYFNGFIVKSSIFFFLFPAYYLFLKYNLSLKSECSCFG